MTEKSHRDSIPEIFNAESIAFVGASNNLRTMGTILPVEREVLGFKAFRKIKEILDKIDPNAVHEISKYLQIRL
jgi:predicted CoA-binding protein